MNRKYQILGVTVLALTLIFCLTTAAMAEQSRGRILGVDAANGQIAITTKIGERKLFDVALDCHIMVNNRRATLYDLRVGDQVAVDFSRQGLQTPVAYSIRVRR